MTAVAPQPSQMSEALQRFLQDEDNAAASSDTGGSAELDSSTLDITSTAVSLEGETEGQCLRAAACELCEGQAAATAPSML